MYGLFTIQRGLGKQWEVRRESYGNSTVYEICATKREALALADRMNRHSSGAFFQGRDTAKKQA